MFTEQSLPALPFTGSEKVLKVIIGQMGDYVKEKNRLNDLSVSQRIGKLEALSYAILGNIWGALNDAAKAQAENFAIDRLNSSPDAVAAALDQRKRNNRANQRGPEPAGSDDNG